MSLTGVCLSAIALTEMKRMKGKAFIDTNLLIYFVSDDLAKKQLVHELLIRNPLIAERQGVRGDPGFEGSRRQNSGPTNRKRLRGSHKGQTGRRFSVEQEKEKKLRYILLIW